MKKRVLAWLLPALSILFTLTFFVAMTSGSAWVSRVAFGRYGSLAIVVALGILAFIGASIWWFGRVSTADERHSGRHDSGAPD